MPGTIFPTFRKLLLRCQQMYSWEVSEIKEANSKIYKLLPQNMNSLTSKKVNSRCSWGIKYLLSLNFKCANQMEGLECSEKVFNI